MKVNYWQLALYDVGLILVEYFLVLPLIARSDTPIIFLDVMRWILGIEVIVFWLFLLRATFRGEQMQ